MLLRVDVRERWKGTRLPLWTGILKGAALVGCERLVDPCWSSLGTGYEIAESMLTRFRFEDVSDSMTQVLSRELGRWSCVDDKIEFR